MKFLAPLAVVVVLVISAYLVCTLYGETPEQKEMLASAESFFVDLKHGRYLNVWRSLTEFSKGKILESIVKKGKNLDKSLLREDFDRCGELCKAYWDTFLKVFDPDLVLSESRWQIRNFRKDRGEIVIKYRDAKRPAILRMFKEGDSWKVGLSESFFPK